MTTSEEVHLETVGEVEEQIFQLFLPSLLTYQFCKFSFKVLLYTSVTTNCSTSVWLSPWVSLKPHNSKQTFLFLDSKQLQWTVFLYNHFPKLGLQGCYGNWLSSSNHLIAQAGDHPAVQDAFFKGNKRWKVENDKVHSGLISVWD